jgi:hypothetical protein
MWRRYGETRAEEKWSQYGENLAKTDSCMKTLHLQSSSVIQSWFTLVRDPGTIEQLINQPEMSVTLLEDGLDTKPQMLAPLLFVHWKRSSHGLLAEMSRYAIRPSKTPSTWFAPFYLHITGQQREELENVLADAYAKQGHKPNMPLFRMILCFNWTVEGDELFMRVWSQSTNIVNRLVNIAIDRQDIKFLEDWGLSTLEVDQILPRCTAATQDRLVTFFGQHPRIPPTWWHVVHNKKEQ